MKPQLIAHSGWPLLGGRVWALWPQCDGVEGAASPAFDFEPAVSLGLQQESAAAAATDRLQG